MERESATNQILKRWLSGAAIGAVAMYLSDPDRGRRRRAIARDKMVSMMHRSSEAIDVASRDLNNRLQGLRAQTNRMLRQRRVSADDQTLAERVRSKIGRAVTHPHAIKVHVQQGCAILSGPILAGEKQQLLEAVRTVEGITEIDDALQVHETPVGVPALQGEGKLRQGRASIMQANWPPAWSAIAAVGGGALAYYGLSRRSALGTATAAAGIGLLVRGVTNTSRMRKTGMGADTQTIHLNKTIYIQAAPDLVFDVWSKYENFPYFMSNVKEIQDLGEGRSHWVVSGPGGVQLEWDSRLTEAERPHVLSWTSESNSPVQHSGTVRLEPAGDGTRANVHMTYTPPAGTIGHAVASLFNGNPKQQLDEDLLRMKAFIESGKPPHDAAKSMQVPSTPGSTSSAVH